MTTNVHEGRLRGLSPASSPKAEGLGDGRTRLPRPGEVTGVVAAAVVVTVVVVLAWLAGPGWWDGSARLGLLRAVLGMG